MQFSVIQTEILDELRQVSTDVLISTTTLKRWINMAMHWALTYKKWPFLEYKGTDLIDSTGTYPYPTRMKTKSAYLILVGAKRFEKIRHEDFLKYLEAYPTGTHKVWAEFDRDIFINGNACTIGESVEIYGQQGVADLSGDTDVTPFDAAEPSGDEAIILKVIARGIRKASGNSADAKQAELDAKELLNNIWDRIQEATPRAVLKQTPLFRKIKILRGKTESQDPNSIGNFDW